MVRFLRIAGYVFLGVSVLLGLLAAVTFWYPSDLADQQELLDLAYGLTVCLLLGLALLGGLLGILAFINLFRTGRAERLTLLGSMVAFALPMLLIIGIFTLGTTGTTNSVRSAEFAALAERAEPLIDDIEHYARDQSRPPPSLEALVPDYLETVPGTGYAAYPDFEYEVFDPGDGSMSLVWYEIGNEGGKGLIEDWDYPQCGPMGKSILVLAVADGARVVAAETDRLPRATGGEPFDRKRWSLHPDDRAPMIQSLLSETKLTGMELEAVSALLGPWSGEASLQPPPAEGVKWELRVPCSRGLLNWDVFFYWPTEDYPTYAKGGVIEEIGRWAYVHE